MSGPGFSGARLRIARHFHQLTQTELANLIAVTTSSICRYETGRLAPAKEGIVDALCDILDVHPSYFYQPPPVTILRDDVLHYRSLHTIPKKARERLLAFGTFVLEWIHQLRQQVRLPKFDIPAVDDLAGHDAAEFAAERCRNRWKLGHGPILLITRVLEHAGIPIATIDSGFREADGFGACVDGQPLVVLNTARGLGSRAIHTCAHELGHLVLHRDPTRATPRHHQESQANRFASAFLLPRTTFPREFWAHQKAGLSEARLLDLKRRWKVSVLAILYRAHQLELIGAAQYRRWMKVASIRGWRSGTPEPNEPGTLRPELLDRAFAYHQNATKEQPSENSARLGWGNTIFSAVTGVDLLELDRTTTFRIP